MDEWLAKQVEAKAQDRLRELIDDVLAECGLSITVQTWLSPEKHHEESATADADHRHLI